MLRCQRKPLTNGRDLHGAVRRKGVGLQRFLHGQRTVPRLAACQPLPADDGFQPALFQRHGAALADKADAPPAVGSAQQRGKGVKQRQRVAARRQRLARGVVHRRVVQIIPHGHGHGGVRGGCGVQDHLRQKHRAGVPRGNKVQVDDGLFLPGDLDFCAVGKAVIHGFVGGCRACQAAQLGIGAVGAVCQIRVFAHGFYGLPGAVFPHRVGDEHLRRGAVRHRQRQPVAQVQRGVAVQANLGGGVGKGLQRGKQVVADALPGGSQPAFCQRKVRNGHRQPVVRLSRAGKAPALQL